MVITARIGLFFWLLAVTLATAVPITCAISRAHPAAPEPVEPCRDSVEVRMRIQNTFECSPGARLTVTSLTANPDPTDILVRCTCPPTAPDAGSL